VYVGGGRYVKGIFWVFNILIYFKRPSLFGNVLGTFQLTLKLQSVAFLGVKNDPKYIFDKIYNQPVFKTICLA